MGRLRSIQVAIQAGDTVRLSPDQESGVLPFYAGLFGLVDRVDGHVEGSPCWVRWLGTGSTGYVVRARLLRAPDFSNPYTDLPHLTYWRPSAAQRVLRDWLIEHDWAETGQVILSTDGDAYGRALDTVYVAHKGARSLVVACGYVPEE